MCPPTSSAASGHPRSTPAMALTIAALSGVISAEPAANSMVFSDRIASSRARQTSAGSPDCPCATRLSPALVPRALVPAPGVFARRRGGERRQREGDPSVLRAPLRGLVVGDRLALAVTLCCHCEKRHLIAPERPEHRPRPLLAQPQVPRLRALRIGVPPDLEGHLRTPLQRLRDPSDGSPALGRDRRRPGGELDRTPTRGRRRSRRRRSPSPRRAAAAPPRPPTLSSSRKPPGGASTNSMRRFCARPTSVALSPTGRSAP